MRKLPKGSEAERRIESFLEHNLELIEPGMVLIRRQYPLKMIAPRAVGKIDLFCQGEDGADVAVELVAAPINAHDLAQCMVYYDVLMRRATSYSKPTPRTYLIGPSCTRNFHHAINALGGSDRINLAIKLFTPRPGVTMTDSEWKVDLHTPTTHLTIKL